jgi:hypothetical protein
VEPRHVLDKDLPPIRRVEQTTATSPSQPPDAVERITPELQTNATASSGIAWNLARQVLVAIVLSAVSSSPQGAVLPLRKRFEIVASAASSPEKVDPMLVEQMRMMFERGASEFFEDGMDSSFARELVLSVFEHGSAAIDALAEYLFSSKANSDVGSEALRRIADVGDQRSLASRWALLQRSLKHRSSRVRDGAILGFAALDDYRAIELLKVTEKEEPIPELRQLIQKVIEQLDVKHGETAAQG